MIIHPTWLQALMEDIEREFPGALAEFKSWGVCPENSFNVELEQTEDGRWRWREAGHWNADYRGEWRKL